MLLVLDSIIVASSNGFYYENAISKRFNCESAGIRFNYESIGIRFNYGSVVLYLIMGVP